MAANQWAVELAEKLAVLSKSIVGPSARVFFVNSGSEGIEAAIKIARAYHRRNGSSQKNKFIARVDAYHGTTMGALSASGFAPMRNDFEPLLPGFRHLPHTLCCRCQLGLRPQSCGLACARAASGVISSETPENVAAVILEPFQNCGGNIPPPDGYFEVIRETCAQNNCLLVLDEAITGFGRLGFWFGAERYRIKADLLVCAKGLTSGYESLGAVIVRREVADVFLGSDDSMFSHGATFGGRPPAAAVALENIAIIEEEKLLGAVRERENEMKRLLRERIQPLPFIGEVRGAGLLFGIDITDGSGNLLPNRGLVEELTEDLCAAGLICCMYATRGEPVLELAPPLTLTSSECRRLVDILEQTLVKKLRTVANVNK
jgi:adenosylmethionine-8-amino-7-oxononanoate aminotransferase